ncbi:hypothetical protein [Amycolatopsis samaneae]|uniref:Uncharacterized protein n=1 Tax=Amycolatopsis samaneae TaxID=664691 RepID=A0ABW5GDE1_9PSEU
MTVGAEHPGHGRATGGAHPGRHRAGAAGTWTPPVQPRHGGTRHRRAAEPIDPPATGSLPLPPQRTPDPGRGSTSGYLGAHGSLPLPAPLPQPQRVRQARPVPPPPPAAPADEPPARVQVSFAAPARERERQQAPRALVKLTPPPPRPAVPEEDDVRVYLAPPADGLGTFDLGSVPASVTPPKTWRKAAWFATGASGAVVIGLLFAGTLLVGKPETEQASQGGWPGYRGGAPVVSEDPSSQTSSGQRGGTGGHPSSGRPGQAVGNTSNVPGGATPGTSGTSESLGSPVADPAGTPLGTSTPRPGSPSSPSASRSPQKPPITDAERTTTPPPVWYTAPQNAQAMGDNSEKFFNTVTTNPAEASSVTTGELHDQGPQRLSERYSDVAYFEVKKVAIDQRKSQTVNTVEVTHKDGTKTIEQHTLKFGDGDKITSDGR